MLLLLPNLLGDIEDHTDALPMGVDRAVSGLDHLIAESEKEARRFLKRFSFSGSRSFRDIPIHLLNEHTTPKEQEELLSHVAKEPKLNWGLISDCGMPCLADPGEDFVLHARSRGVEIKAFAGPSSIMLALILSGLGGQRFTFHGYLPREEKTRIQAIEQIQMLSSKERSVHLFIETPYRNAMLFEQLVSHLQDKTWLCVATDITLPTEAVFTKKVEQWKKIKPPSIDKRPTVFVLRSYASLGRG